jgi:uncharacterized protein YvpB
MLMLKLRRVLIFSISTLIGLALFVLLLLSIRWDRGYNFDLFTGLIELSNQVEPSQAVAVIPPAASATVIETIPPSRTPFQPLPATQTPTITPSSTATLSPTPTSTPSQTSTPIILVATALPKNASIEGIHGRWPAFSLDCEARSAVDWAAYFGVQINELDFFNAIPVSTNPDKGFVGNVNAPWGQVPPADYGVHAGPVAGVLREYGLDAKAVHGMTWKGLRREISVGRPVIVWVIGRVGLGTPIPYTSPDGHETVVARFEHTVIVTGYTQRRVTVLDGYWVYERPVNDFLDSWAVLGNMAVVKNP